MAVIAGIIALVDWSTKFAVARSLAVDEMVVLIEGRVALWHIRNPALILGLFGDLSLASRKGIAVVLGLTTVALLVAVIGRSHRLLPARRPWAWLFGGLLAGGLLGNLGERALHWWVTDFLSFGWGPVWLPPGNVADLAIVCSVPVALLVILFEIEARSLRRTPVGRPLAGTPRR